MKPKEPTSFTAFASDIYKNEKEDITLKDEKLLLNYDERYFFDEAMQIDLEDIETFGLKEDCPMLYLLDKKGAIHSYDIYRKSLQKDIFTVETEENTYTDIALYKNQIYILDNTSVSAFSLTTWQMLWEHTVPDARAMCIDENGYLYIITTSSSDILKIHKSGEEIGTLTIDGVEDPISITVHKTVEGKEKLYILDASKVTVYDEEETKTATISSEAVSLSSLAVNSKEAVYIGSSSANEDGTIWWGSKDTEIQTRLTTYDEAVKKIIFDSKDSLLVLDTRGVISVVKKQKVYKPSGEITYVFDSTYEGCDWHKMKVDYDIPGHGGSVTVSAGAVDAKGQQPTTKKAFENKKDIYLHEAIGRYLVVKITLQSDPMGEETPEFEKLKVYFPKETYLKYLPGIYQENAQSKELMQRYLSVFQTLMEGVEEKIENSHLLIDPQTTPDGEFLNWLSLWLGLKREKNWSAVQWRELLGKAMYFFKRRGTRAGLSELIELYTQIEDKKNRPIIIEPFQNRCDEGNTANRFDLGKYTFCVIFRPNILKSETELRDVERIVKLWKPAHTEGKVLALKDKMVLGEHLCLGINTSLKEEPFIMGEAALSIDTRLADIEENAQIQSHARLGIDTQTNY
ncbi:phage tail protein [Sulfurovum sp.]|uniref:phage tail protein n=1 Tax=Sulfurovum sp. TaxID=1969726 RepID=UPI0025E1ED26|nr:phage tail protein [Sulfurovum sp.]